MLEYDAVREAADYIEARLAGLQGDGGEAPGSPIEHGLILGTGLAGAVASMDIEAQIPYEDVPHMRVATNPIHPGKFVIGTLFGKRTVCMQGRIHLYEGYEPWEVVFPVFVMKLLGVKKLIVTNAAGAINAGFGVEDFVIISDHINFTGKTTFTLGIDPRLGMPCPDMTYAYSPRMRALARQAALQRGEELREGVYIGVTGPTFETPAEIRAFRTLGADLVGMSTVHEAIAASSAGIEMFGVSLVTNMAAGMTDQAISADDVSRLRSGAADRLAAILESVLV